MGLVTGWLLTATAATTATGDRGRSDSASTAATTFAAARASATSRRKAGQRIGNSRIDLRSHRGIGPRGGIGNHVGDILDSGITSGAIGVNALLSVPIGGSNPTPSGCRRLQACHGDFRGGIRIAFDRIEDSIRDLVRGGAAPINPRRKREFRQAILSLGIEKRHQAKHQGEKSYEGKFGFHGFSSALAISLLVALRKGYLAA